MNRRTFVGVSAAAAFGARRLHPEMSGPIRLSVATYSLRQFQRTAAIRAIQSLQIHLADVKDVHMPEYATPAELAAGRRQFEAAKIQLIAGGNVSLKEPAEEGLRRHFEYARNCGLPTMVCSPTHQNLPVVEKLAREYDVRIAIHNHGPEDPEFPGPRSVFEAVKNLDPRMGLCIDIGHTARAGEDIVESVSMAGGRLFEMHFKDLKNRSDKESQCPVGEGVLPIPAIFRELQRIRYAGACSLEYEIDEFDPVPGMQKSFAYMRGVLAGENL